MLLQQRFVLSMFEYLGFRANPLFTADKVQKVPSAARVLDQGQRLLQDGGPLQQPGLPEGRPAAAGVNVLSASHACLSALASNSHLSY